MDDFLVRALLAGIGVAAIAGPLGAFVVWRRMAFFSDTLSHSALLGVALAIFFQVNIALAVTAVSIVLSLALLLLQHRPKLGNDTLLGILSHSALALGLLTISLIEGIRVDLMAYLMGDLLSVNNLDIAGIYLVGLAVIATIYVLWKPLLAITVYEELAVVEGLPVASLRLILMLLLALVIALAMKVVGALLISALLIIPAATARFFSRSPEFMAVCASFLGVSAVVGGLTLSYQWDTPVGPSIVVVSAGFFLIALCIPKPQH